MRKCILHAGTVKTGTKSIQSFLSRARPKLANAGFRYSKSMGQANHVSLAAYAQDDHVLDDLRFRKGVTHADQVQKLRDTIKRDLKEEVRKHDDLAMLLSSEHTSSRLTTDREVDRLRELLSSEFHDIKIIFYLRLQDEMALSTYSTGIRVGMTEPFDLIDYQNSSPVLNYDRLLSRWENVFGKENITVRIFDRSMMPNRSLIEGFLQAANINYQPNTEERKANKSYDIETIELLRLINLHLPRFHENGERNIGRGNIGRIMESISDRAKKPRLSKEHAETLISRFDESNKIVFKRYNLLEGYLRIRSERGNHNIAAPTPLTVERATELFAKIWELREIELSKKLAQLKVD